tara:strand:+ start:562 stop:696 length:135 start_codon:yes stop_codon:yes gene_type:complete
MHAAAAVAVAQVLVDVPVELDTFLLPAAVTHLSKASERAGEVSE